VDGQVVPVEQDFAHGVAQLSAAGVATGDDLAALLAEPLAEEFALRGFADAVAAVDGKEWSGHDDVFRLSVFGYQFPCSRATA